MNNGNSVIAFINFDFIGKKLVADAKTSEHYFNSSIAKKIFNKKVLTILCECINTALHKKYANIHDNTPLAQCVCALKGTKKDTLLITAKTNKEFFTHTEARVCFSEIDILRQLAGRIAQVLYLSLHMQVKIQTSYEDF